MKLLECSECLKLSRESRNEPSFLGESASPFIGEGDDLTSFERECVCVCFLVLLPTPSGIRQFVGAQNTVDA